MIDQALAELLESPDGRRALALESGVFFDTYYCGMRYATHRERWLQIAESAIRTARRDKRKGKLLLLAPRDHGKTEFTITLAARAIALNRNVRILWICESSGQAAKRMRRVKTLLQNPRLVEDWCSPEAGGPFQQTDTDKWTEMQVYVARTLQSVDPTLEAVGSGGAITGGHFDLILCDDLEDDRTTFSAAGRQKTRDWFRGTVAPMLVRDGTMIVIGTRKHADDLYGHVIQDPTFRIITDKAIKRWPKSFTWKYDETDGERQRIVGVDKVEGEAEVLWPEERPLDYLLMERHSVGSRLFSREFQNEVQDDSTAVFKWEWLEHAMERGRKFTMDRLPDVEGLEYVHGWDLSLLTDAQKAERQDSDYTVGIDWGRTSNGDRYLFGMFRQRGMSPGELRQAVIARYARYGGKARAVVVERNSFGELHFLGLQKTTDLPLRAHYTGGGNRDARTTSTVKLKADPWEGVPSLATLFENGKVIIPSGDERSKEMALTICRELWGLGRETHDDIPMAIWIAETELRRNTFHYSVAFDDDDALAYSVDEDGDFPDPDNVANLDDYRRQASREAVAEIWDDFPFLTLPK